ALKSLQRQVPRRASHNPPRTDKHERRVDELGPMLLRPTRQRVLEVRLPALVRAFLFWEQPRNDRAPRDLATQVEVVAGHHPERAVRRPAHLADAEDAA